jgi:hypothetical protein
MLMTFHNLTCLFLILMTLIGCGQDVAKNKKRSKPSPGVTNQPTITSEGLINSQVHRLRGSAVLSITLEIDQILAGTLPKAYKVVPDMTLDDEGRDGKNVITMTTLSRPSTVCGNTSVLGGINNRITDCSNKNGTKAIWIAQTYGAAGESTWKLVALTESGREIWQDLHTGLVWTDVLGAANWCKASGNSQSSSVGVAIN